MGVAIWPQGMGKVQRWSSSWRWPPEFPGRLVLGTASTRWSAPFRARASPERRLPDGAFLLCRHGVDVSAVQDPVHDRSCC